MDRPPTDHLYGSGSVRSRRHKMLIDRIQKLNLTSELRDLKYLSSREEEQGCTKAIPIYAYPEVINKSWRCSGEARTFVIIGDAVSVVHEHLRRTVFDVSN